MHTHEVQVKLEHESYTILCRIKPVCTKIIDKFGRKKESVKTG